MNLKCIIICFQVKKFVRNNDWPVSHEIRSDIWKVLCNNKDFEVHKKLYHEQLDNLTKSGGIIFLIL